MRDKRLNIKSLAKKVFRFIFEAGLIICALVGLLFIYAYWGIVFPTISHSPKDSYALGTADAWRQSVSMATKGVNDSGIIMLKDIIENFMPVSIPDGSGRRVVYKKGFPLVELVVLRKGDDITQGIYAPLLFEVEDRDIEKRGRALFVLEDTSMRKSVSRGFQFIFMASQAYRIFSDPRDIGNKTCPYESYKQFLSLGKILSTTGGERYRELVQSLAVGRQVGIGIEILPDAAKQACRLFGAETLSEKYIITLFMTIHSRFYVIDLNEKDPDVNEQEKMGVMDEIANHLGLKDSKSL